MASAPPPSSGGSGGGGITKVQKQTHWKSGNNLHRVAMGEVASYKIFETDTCVAVLYGTPLTRGHSMLISKQKWGTILDANPAEYAAFMADVPILAHAVAKATNCDGLNVNQPSGTEAGQSVPHVYVEVIPKYHISASAERKRSSKHPTTTSGGSDVYDYGSGKFMSQEQSLSLLCDLKRALPPRLGGWSFHSPTAEHTSSIGEALAAIVQPGDVIFLSGELGSGKTCIARSLIRAFFHNPSLDVPSPSFLLCLTYASDSADYHRDRGDQVMEEVDGQVSGGGGGGDDGARKKRRTDDAGGPARVPHIHHIDPYRLRNKSEGKIAALIDFEEAFTKDITIVEWPERLGGTMVTATSPERLEIRFDGVGAQGQGRYLTMRGVGERWSGLVASWMAADNIVVPADKTGMISFSHAVGGNPMHLGGEGGKKELEKVLKLPEDESQWMVLGIDTSCDDTGAAVVRGDGVILGEELASQTGIHEQFGGVKPDEAQRAHKEAIHRTVDSALAKAKINPAQLTAVAVTVGPGLGLCLEVGVRKAFEIAAVNKLPIVRVHHMEAHALVTRLPNAVQPLVDAAVASAIGQADGPLPLPMITLLISGGHNMIVLTRGVGQHMILGSTVDDSVGEAFDKVGRILGIDAIPAGPQLEKLGNSGNAATYKSKVLVPLTQNKNAELRCGCDFSFAGLKTNMQMLVKEETDRIMNETSDEAEQQRLLQLARADMAATFQAVAVEHLTERTTRAIARVRENDEVKCLVAAGGVAANQAVRAGLQNVAKANDMMFVCPPLRLCTDNGVMIAWAGIERMKLGLHEAPPPAATHERHVEVLPRWPIGPRDPRSVMKPGGN